MRAAWEIGGRTELLLAGDLFDEIDDLAAELAVLDAHERFGQRQTVRRGEKVGDIGRRRRFAHAAKAALAYSDTLPHSRFVLPERSPNAMGQGRAIKKDHIKQFPGKKAA